MIIPLLTRSFIVYCKRFVPIADFLLDEQILDGNSSSCLTVLLSLRADTVLCRDQKSRMPDLHVVQTVSDELN